MITIDEAINTLRTYQPHITLITGSRIGEAINLGIEALEKWRVLRDGRAGIIDPLLPGETPPQQRR